MTAIFFQRDFLDALLRGDKQQTTRKQTDRVKVGDVCNIFTEPRNLIGKVKITEVYDILPINSCGKDAWAEHDGFDDFAAADKWFKDKYGEKWMCKYWTVIRWDGWMVRYFEPNP